MTQAAIDELVERLESPRQGLFVVSRASEWWMRDKPPCDGARLYEVRFSDPSGSKPPTWRREWCVEVPDVMAFVRLHGSCIVGYDADGHETIDIFDGDIPVI